MDGRAATYAALAASGGTTGAEVGDAPPIDEGRPRQEAPSPRTSTADPILRRRRASSLRCEPLSDGRRDPWRYEQRTASRHALSASRDAWSYLAWLGLVDSEGFVAGVLRDMGRAS